MIRGTNQIQEEYAFVYSQRIFVIRLEVKFAQNHQFIQIYIVLPTAFWNPLPLFPVNIILYKLM